MDVPGDQTQPNGVIRQRRCLVALENYGWKLCWTLFTIRSAPLFCSRPKPTACRRQQHAVAWPRRVRGGAFLGRPLPDAESTASTGSCAENCQSGLVNCRGYGRRSGGTHRRPISILSPGNETPFRNLESAVAAELGKENGQVIATGGGAVLRAQNVRALRQNGVVVYIDRPLGQLAVGGARPLSQSAEALAAMHAARAPLYAAACDARVENDGPFESVAEAIKERFYEILDH
ncbi:MAG: shikimate kinase [Ruthenibacterium lactatiformans]